MFKKYQCAIASSPQNPILGKKNNNLKNWDLDLEFGPWDLEFGIWYLELGIWNLGLFQCLNHRNRLHLPNHFAIITDRPVG
jgi:hypothetical protein